MTLLFAFLYVAVLSGLITFIKSGLKGDNFEKYL